MATHLKHKRNSNGTSSQGPGVATLARLAADYQRHADTLNNAIALVTLHQTGRKRTTIAGALDQAIAMDHARRERAAVAPSRRPQARTGDYMAQRLQKRRNTADLLAQFDLVEPREHGGARLGVLVQHGFLKKKGKGYVRTAKPFVP